MELGAFSIKKIIAVFFFLVVAIIPQTGFPKDIVTIQLVSESTSDQQNVPVTFGQVFSKGEIPLDSSLSARLVDGTTIPLQVDRMATNVDGSLRHAIITTQIPLLTAGANESIILTNETTNTDTKVLELSDVLATSYNVKISLNIDGTVYSTSAVESLNSGNPEKWLSGNLVSEWLIDGELKDANGNPHPHLAVYFHVRAYSDTQGTISSIRTDVVIENNWAYENDPKNYTYDATIDVAGKTVYTRTIKHYHHARWNQQVWWGNKPEVSVKHNVDYLLETGAVTNFDRTLQVPETLLNGMLSSWDPMGNGSINAFMPETGADPGIGPLPRWTAAYVISQDKRAKTATLLNGQASGSYSMHYRDKITGKPVSIDNHPKASVNDGDFPALSSPVDTPLTEDTAHHPDLAYIPYLITGDYFYLEEMQFWANYCMLRENPSNRGGGGKDGLIISAQDRAQGWCLRTMGEAAYITPDTHPMKNYFIEKLGNNLTNYNKLYTYGENTSERWNIFGALRPSNANNMDNSRPWMDDFFTWAVGHLAEMGFTEVIPLRNWKAKYPVGRMTEMCYIEAHNYAPAIGTNNPPTFFSSWDEFYENNYGSRNKDGVGFFRDKVCGSQEMADWKNASPKDNGSKGSLWAIGEMSGRSHSNDSYYANAQPALAIAKDAGISKSDIAWDLFKGQNTDLNYPVPGSAFKPDYSSSPQWSVVPRDNKIVVVGPAISLSAQPNPVQPGQSTTITWFVTNADSCEASGDWTGTKSLSSNELVGPISSNKTYTLACTGSGVTEKASITVKIVDSGPIDDGNSNNDVTGGTNENMNMVDGGGGSFDLFTSLLMLLTLIVFNCYSAMKRNIRQE